MNLHGLVASAISVVNPRVTAVLEISNGSTPTPDGRRIPCYLDPWPVEAQVQALGYKDIQQVSSLNLQGVRRKIYFYGDVNGLVRVSQQGGDLVTLPDGTVWLVAMVLEQWPDWCSVAVTLQNDDAIGNTRISQT